MVLTGPAESQQLLLPRARGASGPGLELVTSARACHSLPMLGPGWDPQSSALHASLYVLLYTGIQATFPSHKAMQG